MKNILCTITAYLGLLLYGSPLLAAPVIDISEPQIYSAPTTAELALFTTLAANSSLFSAGSSASAFRESPTTLINAGLDAQPPALMISAQNNELGILPLPQVSYICPAGTAVTITISEYQSWKTAETHPGLQFSGLGTSLIDSRELINTAAVTAALFSGDVGQVGSIVTLPSRTYNATFGDLPFYTMFTSFGVAQIVLDGAMLVPAQTSYEVSPPSISYEYDNSACTFRLESAMPVPAINAIQLLVLAISLLLLGVGACRLKFTV